MMISNNDSNCANTNTNGINNDRNCANNINDAVFYIEPGIQLRIPQNIGNILKDLEKINK